MARYLYLNKNRHKYLFFSEVNQKINEIATLASIGVYIHWHVQHPTMKKNALTNKGKIPLPLLNMFILISYSLFSAIGHCATTNIDTPLISGNSPICIGATVQLTGSGIPNATTPWTSSNPVVATIDNTGLVTGVSAGTSTITYMDNSGSTNTVVVTVNPDPSISGNAPICISATVQLTGSGTPDPMTPWTSSKPFVATIDNTGLVTGVSAGTSTITYTDVNGCSNTVSATVNPVPTIIGNAPICAGATVQLTGSGIPDATTPWTSSNPFVATIDNTGLVTGVSAGTSTITYTDVNGCSNTVVVTVNSGPVISGTSQVCIGATVQLNGSGTPDATTPWASSNPAVATINNTGLVTGVSVGTSTMTYTDNAGCRTTVVITVNSIPVTTATNSGPYCTGDAMAVNETGGDAVSWSWISDGTAMIVSTTDQTPTIAGAANGETFTVTITDANGCTNTAQTTVTINPTPTISGNSPICIGATVQLTGSGTPDATTLWTSSNPAVATIDNTGLVTGISAGTSTIICMDANGCQNNVFVNVTPSPLLVITSPTAVCSPNTVDLTLPNITAGSSPGTYTYWTDINGSNALATPSAVSTSGTYYIRLDDGTCSNIQPVNVTINPSPTISGNTTICPGSTTELTGSGTPSLTSPWSSSNVAVATIDNLGVVSGISEGTTIITYTDIGGCQQTQTIIIADDALNCCHDLTIDAGQCHTVYYGYGPLECAVQSITVSGGTAPYSYAWSTGETTPSIEVCPTGTTEYSVTVTDANGCSQTSSTGEIVVNVIDVHCGNNGKKVMICHYPPGNPNNPQMLCISSNAVPAHIDPASGHSGCHLGPCDADPCPNDE